MDAVPGIPTTLWFTPLYTTEEMRAKTGQSDFEYEISCDQMCGKGHYTMRGVIKVVTQDEYLLWRAKQKATYAQINEAKTPAAPAPGGTGTTDSTAQTVTSASSAVKANIASAH
jgi:cytochrome c oxidase subunit 2